MRIEEDCPDEVDDGQRLALEQKMRRVDVQDGVECPWMLEGDRGRRRMHQ